MKRLLKGGMVISGSGCKYADVLIDGSVIQAVETEIKAEELKDVEVVDITGKLLFPGFIDAHTHFELPVAGTVTVDGFETGTKAAIAGGTTMIIDFATQYQGETLNEALDHWRAKADGKSSCDYGFHMAISDWNEQTSEDLQLMIDAGVTSFKLYMTYDEMYLEDKRIFQVLKRLKEVGGITGVHCENKGMIEALVKEEKDKGHLGVSTHAVTRPAIVEAEAIDRLLKIAKLAETPVIIVHLSSAAGYLEVCEARVQGQEFFVETCPQYLFLDDSRYQLEGFEGAKYIIAPPLRHKEDQAVLWEAIKNGQIQTIATDHCSFTKSQKAMGKDDFTKIPGGMPGVENRPTLMYSYGVKENKISVEQMCRLLSEHAAKLYGMYPQKGCIQVGSDADLVVWDPDQRWTISIENQIAKCDYSPFEGFEVIGKASQVYLRGELVACNGEIVKEHQGEYTRRGRWMSCHEV